MAFPKAAHIRTIERRMNKQADRRGRHKVNPTIKLSRQPLQRTSQLHPTYCHQHGQTNKRVTTDMSNRLSLHQQTTTQQPTHQSEQRTVVPKTTMLPRQPTSQWSNRAKCRDQVYMLLSLCRMLRYQVRVSSLPLKLPCLKIVMITIW
jgi:hypothetical protein